MVYLYHKMYTKEKPLFFVCTTLHYTILPCNLLLKYTKGIQKNSLHLSCSVFFTLYHTLQNLLVLVYILISISRPKIISWSLSDQLVCLIRLNGHISFSIVFLALSCWKDIEGIEVLSCFHFFIIIIIYGYCLIYLIHTMAILFLFDYVDQICQQHW